MVETLLDVDVIQEKISVKIWEKHEKGIRYWEEVFIYAENLYTKPGLGFRYFQVQMMALHSTVNV